MTQQRFAAFLSSPWKVGNYSGPDKRHHGLILVDPDRRYDDGVFNAPPQSLRRLSDRRA